MKKKKNTPQAWRSSIVLWEALQSSASTMFTSWPWEPSIVLSEAILQSSMFTMFDTTQSQSVYAVAAVYESVTHFKIVVSSRL